MTTTEAINTSTETKPAASPVLLAIDSGNGSLKWAVRGGGADDKIKAGSVPNLILPTPHPSAASIDGQTFVYGAMAAKLDLQAAHNPGRTGTHKGKGENLNMVLAAAIIEAGLVGDAEIEKIEVRIATPLNCQLEAHQELIGQHLISAPKGGGSQLVEVVAVTSYQEARPLLSNYDGVVDCGSGTTFYGFNDGHGRPVIKTFDSGVNGIIQSAVDDCTISERYAQSDATSKGVLSPEGLSASLASGRAITDEGIIYKGVQFADILKPLVRAYWKDTVKRAISQVAVNAVPVKDVPVIAVVGGGADLLQSLLSKQELENTGLGDTAIVKFIKKPAVQLVTAMLAN